MPTTPRIRNRHPRSRPLDTRDIRKTARTTSATLALHGLQSCLFGSAACSMYGLTRVPNDVDMVVLTNQYTPGYVQELIACTDSRFFLVKPHAPGATYKILYYTLHSGRFCEVDILLPGILNIPFVPIARIVYTRVPDVPVMPLVAVIFLKLQGWTDHRDSEREDFQDKQYVDIDDIWDMLDIWVTGHRHETVATESWMPEEFVEAAKGRVQEFIGECPDTENCWRFMGFNFPEKEPLDIFSTKLESVPDWGDFTDYNDWDSERGVSVPPVWF